MPAHGLSDQQVDAELRKMTAFIRQEAEEKAREIQIKADEEFSIEKTKLVRQETDALDEAHAKKLKQASLSQQITRSTMNNKSRLRVLGARQELLDRIFESAAQNMRAVTKDKARYQAALKDLILQGAITLNESEVTLRARKADADLVKKAAGEATKEFKSRCGRDVKITIDDTNVLPAENAGGVIVLSTSGKIDLDNTLEARLNILRESALPAIRADLFGANPNRKFTD